MQPLTQMEYPGRFIILGKNEAGENILAYGITGRHPSSKARRMQQRGNIVTVEMTDETLLKDQDSALLVYDAIVIDHDRAYVSNGAQTRLIHSRARNFESNTPYAILHNAMSEPYIVNGTDITSFEPDKNHTPRISGCMIHDNAALQITKKRHSGGRNMTTRSVRLQKGWGMFVSTYRGQNKDPAPAFDDLPQNVSFFGSLENIAQSIFDSLPPDVAVSVAAVAPKSEMTAQDMCIINKY